MENELQITTNEKNDAIITNPNRRLVIETEMGEQIKIKIKDGKFEIKFQDKKIVISNGSTVCPWYVKWSSALARNPKNSSAIKPMIIILSILSNLFKSFLILPFLSVSMFPL